MKVAGRMSFEEAQLAARKLAEALLEASPIKECGGSLQNPAPDPIERETLAKVSRHWLATVNWTEDSRVFDGPSVIEVDLLEKTAAWRV